MDAVVLAVYVSLSISWVLRCSGCDLWPTFRPTCAQLWEVLHVSRLNTLVGGGVRVSGGWGGCDNVLVDDLLDGLRYLATSNTLLLLRHGTCSCMELVLDAIHL